MSSMDFIMEKIREKPEREMTKTIVDFDSSSKAATERDKQVRFSVLLSMT